MIMVPFYGEANQVIFNLTLLLYFSSYIEAKTKWLRISRHFREVCSQVSNWQYTIIGSDNGLASDGRQAVIWPNDGLF